MTQLWRVPATEPDYQETLAQPCDLTSAPNKPESFPDKARVWGVRTDSKHERGPFPRNENNLERMEAGDPLLIYRKMKGRYEAAGYVGGPIWHTTWVRNEFWDGGPALDIFYIDNWTPVHLDRRTVNQILGYEENDAPQGLRRVADKRPSDKLLQRIGF